MGCSPCNPCLGLFTSNVPASRGPVPEGKLRICIAGFNTSPYTGRARHIASYLAKKYPDKYETWFYWDRPGRFLDFMVQETATVTFPPELKGHGSSPFVWFERGPAHAMEPVGGCDRLTEWARREHANDSELLSNVAIPVSVCRCGDLCHNSCCCVLTEPEFQATAGRSPLAAPSTATAML